MLKRRGRVSITHYKHGRINFHISVPWKGTIAVTMPRLAKSEVVTHRVGDMWLPEGTPGQRTVWVTQLSFFDTVKAKAKAAVCFLQLSKAKIAACLVKKLPGKIGKDLGSWLSEKLGHNCAAALISNGIRAPVATLWEDAPSSTPAPTPAPSTPAPLGGPELLRLAQVGERL